MSYSTLTRKGQITIPKLLRDELGLELGDRVAFRRRGNEIVLKPLQRTLLDLAGSVKPKNQPEDFSAIRREVAAARGRRRAERGHA